MNGILISSHSSSAEVSLQGAHVARVSLDGREAVKPSVDGVQTHGGIAVLIPYAGRVRDGRYAFDGVEYRLPVGPEGHASHGFAKDSRWRLVDKRGDSVTLWARLRGDGYPGVLDARLTYAVARASFATTCEVENAGVRDCPLAVGFHPYFLARGWRIFLGERAYRYALADGYFPTGEKAMSSTLVEGRSGPLDAPFLVRGAVQLRDRARSLTILRRRMPYLLVYNGKHAERRSVAIEPYTALPDAYNNGLGLVRLEPGKRFTCGYRVVSRRLGRAPLRRAAPHPSKG